MWSVKEVEWRGARTSRTSSGEPRMTGTRWWTFCGMRSMIRVLPVSARPPACSIRYAIGAASYSSRSLPFVFFASAG